MRGETQDQMLKRTFPANEVYPRRKFVHRSNLMCFGKLVDVMWTARPVEIAPLSYLEGIPLTALLSIKRQEIIILVAQQPGIVDKGNRNCHGDSDLTTACAPGASL